MISQRPPVNFRQCRLLLHRCLRRRRLRAQYHLRSDTKICGTYSRGRKDRIMKKIRRWDRSTVFLGILISSCALLILYAALVYVPYFLLGFYNYSDTELVSQEGPPSWERVPQLVDSLVYLASVSRLPVVAAVVGLILAGFLSTKRRERVLCLLLAGLSCSMALAFWSIPTRLNYFLE